MEKKYFPAEFNKFINTLFSVERSSLPTDTGFMKDYGYMIKKTSVGWDILIDDSIVPYAKWVEQNPNKSHGFWTNYYKTIIEEIKKQYGGKQ